VNRVNWNAALMVAVAAVASGCGGTPYASKEKLDGGTEPTGWRAEAGKEASTVGPISAEVTGWRVGRAKFLDYFGKEQETKDEFFIIELKFSTTDPTVAKHSLGQHGATAATLRDEAGNTYHGKVVIERFVGRSKSNTIRAGEPATDVWLFEKPLPSAQTLTLDFRGKAVELEDGTFRFTIPLKK
jgi:hypothetical protein